MSALKFFFLLVLILLAGVIQNTNFLAVAGVKPNLLLAVLIAASFFIEDAWLYVFFVLAADVFLKTQTAVEPELLVFPALVLLAGWFGRRLHWWPLVSNLALTALATAVFYLLVAPGFLIGGLWVVFGEMVYNVVVGLIIFKALEACLKTSSMLKT